MIRRPPRSPLFPYTTLFRSAPFAIGPAERDAWLTHMRAAVDSLGLTAEQDATLWGYLEMAALSMQNRFPDRSEEHTSELQSRQYLVCRLLLEKKTRSPGRCSPLPGPPQLPHRSSSGRTPAPPACAHLPRSCCSRSLSALSMPVSRLIR